MRCNFNMAKKAQKTKVKTCVKCECSICGQVAFAQANTHHVFCKGISLSIIAQLPAALKSITNPSRIEKAMWVPVVVSQVA